jgi:hypothetical protein
MNDFSGHGMECNAADTRPAMADIDQGSRLGQGILVVLAPHFYRLRHG